MRTFFLQTDTWAIPADPIILWLYGIITAVLFVVVAALALNEEERVMYRCIFYSGVITMLLAFSVYATQKSLDAVNKYSIYIALLAIMFVTFDLWRTGCSNFRIVLTLSIPIMVFFVLIWFLAKPNKMLMLNRNVALIGIIVTGDLMICSLAGLVWELKNGERRTRSGRRRT